MKISGDQIRYNQDLMSLTDKLFYERKIYKYKS